MISRATDRKSACAAIANQAPGVFANTERVHVTSRLAYSGDHGVPAGM